MRGLERRHEQNQQQLIRDTRTLGQRVADFFKSPHAVGILLIVMGISTFLLPGLADIALLLGLLVFAFSFGGKPALPFRMPKRSGRKDYNDLIPGYTKTKYRFGYLLFW